MDVNKHTHAPWYVDFNKRGTMSMQVVGDTNEQLVALVYGETEDVQIANVKLIAAAPNLIEALKNMRMAFDISNEKYTEWTATLEIYDAMSLIDKAIKDAT